MNIVFIGDVVGANGVNILKKGLPGLKKQYQADICIVNGENANAQGTGLNSADAQHLFACGADVITGGNHSMRKADISLYEENPFLLCPANLLYAQEGCGVANVDLGKHSICVINLLGTAFLENHRNPFFEIDAILKNVTAKNILVDFHAESTAEKYAMAYYLDGKVSAVVGTHTHVQTNDETILPGKTAYITDVGCVCSSESVLGIPPHLAIKKQKYLCPVKFQVKDGNGYINGVFIQTDAFGKAIKIEKIHHI